MKRILPLLLVIFVTGSVLAQQAPTTVPTPSPVAPPLPQQVTRIAFGSCCRQDKPAPIFDAIVGTKPDVMIWLGDNIYGDSDDPAVIRAKYAALGARPEFQRLRKKVPFLYVWDDHDFGKNDAGAEYKFKEQNKQIMLDFFGEPKASERRLREGNYDSIILGPEGKRVQFLLLDTRSFRSPLKQELRDGVKWNVPNEDPDATVLGEAQWKWLEAELQKPADVRIVCSSIQVIPTDHRFEKWSNFPKDRQRLIDLLKPHAWTTLIISGDRHHGSVHEDPASGLAEVTASSFNQGGTPTPQDMAAPTNQRTPTGKVNFGEITITWPAPPLRPSLGWGLNVQGENAVTYQVRGESAMTTPTTQP